jgi:hypothetical protein
MAALLLGVGCGDHTATALPTPMPHPTVIVITAEGPYFTQFDDAGDWLVGETDGSAGQVHDGEYFLAVKKPHALAWASQPRIFGEGVYEVNARLVSGPEASGYGLLLMAASDLSAFFYVEITGDGRYDVGTCIQSCTQQQSIIGGYKLAPAILTDNQANHLKVTLHAGQLTLEVNGAAISQVQGLVYSRGVVGLIGESSQFGGFEAAFDNLSVVESQPVLAPTEVTPLAPTEAAPPAQTQGAPLVPAQPSDTP